MRHHLSLSLSLSLLASDDGPVDERYLMRAERKRRRKLARQARVLNVGRYPWSFNLLRMYLYAVAVMLPAVRCVLTH